MSKKIIVLMGVLIAMLSSEFAASAGALKGLIAVGRTATGIAGAVANTPAEDLFSYGGQKFILLDKEEKDNQTYFFVMCEDVYGAYRYDFSTRSNDDCLAYWEPNDVNTMAYWLNNTFWENGNGGKALPAKIKEYIDQTHIWHTEPLKNLSGYQAENLTTHPLALLADYEWKQHIKKIGQNVSTNYFFRTARTVDVPYSNTILCSGSANPLGTTGAWRANGTALDIRPVFYLSAEFFAHEKLNSVGANVALSIDAYCNPDLYSEAEKNLFFPAPVVWYPDISGEIVVGQTLRVDYRYEGAFPEGQSKVIWYQADDAEGSYSVIEGENKKELLLTESLQGKYIKAAVVPVSQAHVNPVGGAVMVESAVGFIFGDAQIKQAIQSISDASPEKIMEELEKANVVLHLDLDLYMLEPSSRENAMVIFSKMEFDTIEKLRSSYNAAVKLALLNEIDNITFIPNLLTDKELGLDLTRFKKLTSTDKIIEAVFQKKFDDFKKFEKVFYPLVALGDVSQADKDTIKEILLIHKAFFAADLSKLTDYQLGLVGTEIYKKSFSDFPTLDAAITQAAMTAGGVEPPADPIVPDKPKDSNRKGGGSPVTWHDTTIPSLAIGEETEPEEVIPPKIEFNDLDQAEWAKDTIYALAEKKIVAGDGNGNFRPNAILTREEFVRMAVSAFYPEEQAEAMTFSDVPQEAWYAPYIAVAANQKLVHGISDTEFGVGTPVTREDMVLILYRTIQNKKNVTFASFADAETISSYAAEAVFYMAGAGIVSGMGENNFEPKSPATRAMAAQVLYKTMQFLGK